METGALAEAAMQYAETGAAQSLKKQGVSNYLSKFTWPKSSALNLLQKSALGTAERPSNEEAWKALQTSFKAQLARTLFGHSVYLQVLAQNDPAVRLASNPQFSASASPIPRR
jgi:hypothetical protein